MNKIRLRVRRFQVQGSKTPKYTTKEGKYKESINYYSSKLFIKSTYSWDILLSDENTFSSIDGKFLH